MNEHEIRWVTILRSLLLNLEILGSELKKLESTRSLPASSECIHLLKELQEAYVRGLKQLERITNAR